MANTHTHTLATEMAHGTRLVPFPVAGKVLLTKTPCKTADKLLPSSQASTLGPVCPCFFQCFFRVSTTKRQAVWCCCKENHVVPSRGWQRALQGRWWTCRLALACCGGSSSYFLLVGNLTGLVALLHSRIALSTKPLVLRNLLRVTSRRHQVGFQNPDTPPSSH